MAIGLHDSMPKKAAAVRCMSDGGGFSIRMERVYLMMPRFDALTKSTISLTIGEGVISAAMDSRAWVVFILLR